VASAVSWVSQLVVRLTAEARFQSGVNICKTFRAERDILTGFSLSATTYVTSIIPANVLHSLTQQLTALLVAYLERLSHVLRSNGTLKLGDYKILRTAFSNLLLISKFNS
jgi:hypothetical protein